MASDNPTIFQRVRQFLRSDIKGKFTNAVLQALAAGDAINDANIVALQENMLIATASAGYLDKLASRLGVVRPAGVGIDDDSFRNLAIGISNKQAISSIFLELLELFYGADAVHANTQSGTAEPYQLSDGMTLQVLVDGAASPLIVTFTAADFTDINQASAIEVATVIARTAIQSGYNLTATNFLDSTAGLTYVQLLSNTRGPKSAVTVTGGSAQNILLFPAQRPTTQAAGTQWTVSIQGGFIRYTWTGGADPTLQNISVGDYVNISSPPFSPEQFGTFTITKVNPDVVSVGYFEIVNPLVQSSAVYTQANKNDILFFQPKRITINNLSRFATIYEVNPYELVVYIPATTQIVKRTLTGGWHAHASGQPDKYIGAYTFNPKSGITISSISTVLNQTLSAGQPYTVVSSAAPTTNFPDQAGYVVLDFGTSNQEGPIKYLGRPSNNTLLLDASYVLKKTHINPDVSLVATTQPYQPATDGSDYPTYLTGTVQGRLQAQALAASLAAAGIFLNIIIVYPSGPGLNSVVDVYAGDQT